MEQEEPALKQEAGVINEDEVGVPYEQPSLDENEQGELFQYDDYSDLTPEEREKHYGIEIPMCAQHTNPRVALHLR